MKGPAGKAARRKSALERRKNELKFWNSKAKKESSLPPSIKEEQETSTKRKIKICEQDIKNLEAKI